MSSATTDDEPLTLLGVNGDAGFVRFNRDGTVDFGYLVINAPTTPENLALAVINTLTEIFKLKPTSKEKLN